MDLISLQNSWNTIDSTIQSNYDNSLIKIPYLNFKNFLFNNTPKKIFYVDSMNDDDCISFLLDHQLGEHLVIVLKNTITTIGSSAKISGAQFTTTIVFKHNLAELQILSNNYSFNNLFGSTIDYIVPTGLKQDYISVFDQKGNSYWDGLTTEQKSALVTEGSEEY